jgi:hypothetical protein
MTDLTGHPELTPHKGGWCGNDIFPAESNDVEGVPAGTQTVEIRDKRNSATEPQECSWQAKAQVRARGVEGARQLT